MFEVILSEAGGFKKSLSNVNCTLAFSPSNFGKQMGSQYQSN